MVIALITFFSSAIFAEENKFSPLPETPQNSQEQSAEISGKLSLTSEEHTIHTAQADRLNQGVTALLGIIIILIFFWNRKLNKQLTKRRNIEKKLQNSENRYLCLNNASFEGIVISENGVIFEANNAISELSGYSVSELIGMAVVDIFAQEVRDDVKAKIQAGYEKIYASMGLTKAGVQFPVEIQAREFIHEHRRVRCAAIRDLSKHYEVMEALRESEKKFRTVVTGALDAIVMIDAQGKVTFWNKAAERIFQYSENEMMGKNPHDVIMPPVFSKAHKKAYSHFQQTGKGGVIDKTIELSALKKDGEEFPIELSLSAVQIKERWCAIAVIRDISERKQMEAELTRLATTDVLTGVDNRRSFMEKAEHEITRAQRYGVAFTMMIMDIDFFKSINDKYGHQAGDIVLQKMAQAVKSALRDSDIFGRIGGEEFAIVLIEAEQKTALLTAERIRSLIETLDIKTEKETVQITVSIGLTFFKSGDDMSTLSKRSDEALYSAKRSGRNRVVSL
jgi:diguanylate cyclase (GGDEF)-like protein/PAS domain S-box-containing protein